MRYAIVLINKQQYKVSVGDELLVEKIEEKEGKKFKFDQVLLTVKDEKIVVGTPYVIGALVEATLLEQVKAKKIRVVKFRAKSRYRRVTGHRQKLTKLKIEKIKFPSTSK